MNIGSAGNNFAPAKVSDIKSSQASSSDKKTDDFKDLMNKSLNNKKDTSVSNKKTDSSDKTDDNSLKTDKDNNSSKTESKDKTENKDKTEKEDGTQGKNNKQNENVKNENLQAQQQNVETVKGVVDMSMIAAMLNGTFVDSENAAQTTVKAEDTFKTVQMTEKVDSAVPIIAENDVSNSKTESLPVVSQSTSELNLGEKGINTNVLKQETSYVKKSEVKTATENNNPVKADNTSTKETEVKLDIQNTHKTEKTPQHAADKTSQLTSEAKKVSEESVKTENFKEVSSETKTDIKAETIIPQVKPEHSENVKIKVGDAVIDTRAENFEKKLADEIVFKSTNGNNEFEVELMPKELGKITIKLVFEEGHATVSMACSNPKTLSLLAENAGNISAIIQNSTGNQTTVTVNEEKQPYDQNGQNSKGENPQEQNQENRRNHHQHNTDDFMQQLRLGLVDLNDFSSKYSF